MRHPWDGWLKSVPWVTYGNFLYFKSIAAQPPYLLNKDDSGGWTHTKMMHILYSFWWYQPCWWPFSYRFGAIWFWRQLCSCNIEALNHLYLFNEEDSGGLTPKQCTFCVWSDDIHIVSDISDEIQSHLAWNFVNKSLRTVIRLTQKKLISTQV